MHDNQIKKAIADHYQVELDNLANTDTLADLLETGEDDEVDQANHLLTGARIEIHWQD